MSRGGRNYVRCARCGCQRLVGETMPFAAGELVCVDTGWCTAAYEARTGTPIVDEVQFVEELDLGEAGA